MAIKYHQSIHSKWARVYFGTHHQEPPPHWQGNFFPREEVGARRRARWQAEPCRVMCLVCLFNDGLIPNLCMWPCLYFSFVGYSIPHETAKLLSKDKLTTKVKLMLLVKYINLMKNVYLLIFLIKVLSAGTLLGLSKVRSRNGLILSQLDRIH